ncbi:hypothetical protein MSPP1_001858 [Malassezia sp. CBS 17886]|nr:hypothetical protein MSPP1_001858 [Malassezia sp. CBS 17886]
MSRGTASLADGHCAPCTKKAIRELGLQPLSSASTAALLAQLAHGWSLHPAPNTDAEPTHTRALRRVYKFRNFATAAAFTGALAAESDREGHHPAVLLEWGSVAVWWWSHSLQGLHENDFVMAARTDRLADAADGRKE